MKLLNGTDLAGFIKERHARQVRSLLRQGVKLKLAIVQAKDDPVINTYIKLKQQYGADIGVDVDIYNPTQKGLSKLVKELNHSNGVHGIIIQLPLENPEQTDEAVNLVAPQKDVDGLGSKSIFDPATPMAILWLLSGYNIELGMGRKILLVGRGKLVGAPLEKILKHSGYDVGVADRETPDLASKTKEADIIITATGHPSILQPDMIKQSAVVIDAGVASEEGKTVGDLDPAVYDRDDLTITPKKGGVGPLTVCALFENLIRATETA